LFYEMNCFYRLICLAFLVFVVCTLFCSVFKDLRFL